MPITNTTRRTLEAGDPVIGGWVASMSARAAEVLAASGVDWAGVDMEHTPISAAAVEDVIRAIEPHATPIVRLPTVEATVAGAAKRALDSGAHGLIIPRVESPADARAAVAAARYPPTGDRGIAGTTRANRYGVAFDDYADRANDEVLLVAQLETEAAAERVDDILEVEGIDVAFIGENDLSTTLGHPGEKDRAVVREAVETIVTAARDHDIHVGASAGSPAAVDDRIDRGFRFFLCSSDLGFVRRGVEPFVQR